MTLVLRAAEAARGARKRRGRVGVRRRRAVEAAAGVRARRGKAVVRRAGERTGNDHFDCTRFAVGAVEGRVRRRAGVR